MNADLFLFILSFLLLLVLYALLIGYALKKYFPETQNTSVKRRFVLAAALPVLLLVSGIFTMSVSNPSPYLLPCEEYLSAQDGSFSFVIPWETIASIVFLVILAIWFVLLITLPVSWYRSSGVDRKILGRALAVALFALVPLGLIILSSLNTNRPKSTDGARKAFLSQVRVMNEVYLDEHPHYPISRGSNNIERWSNFWKDHYPNQEAPKDPCFAKTGDPRAQYDYQSSPDGSRWIAYAYLQALNSQGEKSIYCVDATGVVSTVRAKDFDVTRLECPKE